MICPYFFYQVGGDGSVVLICCPSRIFCKGEHILIDRNDKRSQLRSFKQAINYLKDGVPIMAFPEGARSPDGRLMAFKPGK